MLRNTHWLGQVKRWRICKHETKGGADWIQGMKTCYGGFFRNMLLRVVTRRQYPNNIRHYSSVLTPISLGGNHHGVVEKVNKILFSFQTAINLGDSENWRSWMSLTFLRCPTYSVTHRILLIFIAGLDPLLWHSLPHTLHLLEKSRNQSLRGWCNC